jgi:hypothetical protein
MRYYGWDFRSNLVVKHLNEVLKDVTIIVITIK